MATNIRARILAWLPFGWVRHIMRDGQSYLDRYSLRAQGPSGHNPWRIYLHQFHAADMPDPHNHPSAWSFSIVLWGSYTEEVLPPRCKWHSRTGLPVGYAGHPDYDFCIGGVCQPVRSRRVRWFNWIPADKYHRIAELHPGPGARGVWTLFICGPLTGRGWGFWQNGRHVAITAADRK